MSIPSRRRTRPKRRNPAEDVAQLAGPKQPEEDDSRCDRDCGSPVRPLTQVCVPHVLGVDAKYACHGAKREEYDRDDGERVDGALLAVLGCLDLVLVLQMQSENAQKGDSNKFSMWAGVASHEPLPPAR